MTLHLDLNMINKVFNLRITQNMYLKHGLLISFYNSVVQDTY